MSYKFLTVLICFLMVACDSNNAPKNSIDSKTANNTDPLTCYRYVGNKDTISLKTVNVNGSITGTLIYKLYEKDKNAGTIQGKMKGDLLIADYSFMAEGMNSTRQVVFKRNGNDFVEGYGEIEEKDNKVVFKNVDSLDFNNSIVLKITDCEK